MGPTGRTSAEYQAEIAALQAEVGRLRQQTSLTLLGSVRAAPRTDTGTIAGIDETRRRSFTPVASP